MAIQVRRGLKADFDPNKLLPGEFAAPLDTKELYLAYGAGDVKRMGTYEDMQDNIKEATQDIANNLTNDVKVATTNANNQAAYAKAEGDYAKEQGDYTKTKGQEAQSIIDSAAPILNQNLQATYADKGKVTGKFVNFQFSDDGLAQIDAKGISEQVKTDQGKNILDINKFVKTPNTSSVVISNNKVTVSGVSGKTDCRAYCELLLKAGTYTMSNTVPVITGTTSPASGLFRISYIVDGTEVFHDLRIANSVRNKAFTISSDTKVTIHAYVAGQDALTENVTVEFDSLMLEIGSTATPYEPFVPNSPSPEYPSPIVSPAPFDIVSIHENFTPIATSTRILGGVTFTPQSNGGILISGTATAAGDYYVFHKSYNYNTNSVVLNGNVKYICSFGNSVSVNNLKLYVAYYDLNGGSKYSADLIPFEVPDTQIIAGMFIRTTVGVTYNNVLVYPKLEQGTTATPYILYEEDRINIPYELGEWNDIKDGSYVNGAETIIFDGDESWTKSTTTIPYFEISLPKSKSVGGIICDRFPKENIANADTVDKIAIFLTANKTIRIRTGNTLATTLQDFKNWLSSNPITVRYELETPLVAPLNTYLKTYKGTTNVFTTANPPVEITATFKSQLWADSYLKDKAIESKIDDNKRVNNLLSTDPTTVLSGAMGKQLQTNIEAVNAKVGQNLTGTTFTKFTAKPSDMLSGSFSVSNVVVVDQTTAVNAPTDRWPCWYNIVTFGISSRCTQIAYQNYLGQYGGVDNNVVYLRNQHDLNVSDWVNINHFIGSSKSLTSLDNARTGGVYAVDYTATGIPIASYGLLTVKEALNNSWVEQKFTTVVSPNITFRRYSINSTGWTAWENNDLRLQKIYAELVNGVATYSMSGITSNSIVMANTNQGNTHYVTQTSTSTNTITIKVNSTDANGLTEFIIYVQK